MTLTNSKEGEKDTWKIEYSMKKTLFKVKERENYSHKSESDTCKNKGVQKWKLGTLTRIILQLQPKWGRLSTKSAHWRLNMSVKYMQRSCHFLALEIIHAYVCNVLERRRILSKFSCCCFVPIIFTPVAFKFIQERGKGIIIPSKASICPISWTDICYLTAIFPLRIIAFEEKRLYVLAYSNFC